MPEERISNPAIRTSRPYADEEEFLEQELDMMSRAGMVLVGVPERPTGTVVRFEVTLASGAPLVRGEGRVVGYMTGPKGDKAGLALRFTRLDTRSKALVDRATALRASRGRPSIELQRVDIRGERASMPPLVRDSILPPPDVSADSTGELLAISPLSSSGEMPAVTLASFPASSGAQAGAALASADAASGGASRGAFGWARPTATDVVGSAAPTVASHAVATARAYVPAPESGVELSPLGRREHLAPVPSPIAPNAAPAVGLLRSREELLAKLRARARNVSAASISAMLRR